jgi:hypothetical protein
MYYKITVANLLKIFPQAECCDCSKNPEDCPEEQLWIVYHDNIIYCPQCAKNENIYD